MKLLIGCIFSLLIIPAFSQVENKDIVEGNEKYNKNDYAGAQQSYQNALQKNAQSEAGNFNMGNSLFQQKNYEEAVNQYQKTVQTTTDPQVRSQAYHNMGNALLEQKKYQESIDAYKQALRNNPDDAETKYNLAYAQKMLQQQQKNQNQNKQNQDQQKQDQQKQNQKQDENKQNQDQQNQNNQDQAKNDQQKQQQPAQPKQFSKDELDRIMQALNSDDKNVQDKINAQKVKATDMDIEKDW